MRLLLGMVIGAATCWAQHSSATITNPHNTAEDRVQGEKTFRSQCGACHGLDAKGGSNGPDLSKGQYKHAISDEAMLRVITKGIAGTAMPGFALEGKAAWQTVAYLRGLAKEGGALNGDAARGEKLFGELKCGGCHSSKAPHLGDATLRMSRADLRRAIVEPASEVAPEYWQWRWRLKNGTTVEGLRMNEDTFSVQVMLPSGRLRTFSTREILNAEHEKKSSMPTYEKLSTQDVDCLVAYLFTLRGK